MNYTGEELRKLRIRLMLTQQQMGDLVNARTETIVRWEHMESYKPVKHVVFKKTSFEIISVLLEIVEQNKLPQRFNVSLRQWSLQGHAYLLYRILDLRYGPATKS